MKEHPIIFSTEMVKVILEGRKTMTRRVIKPQPIHSVAVIKQHSCFPDLWVPYTNDGRMVNNNLGSHKNDCEYFCPYGQVGDRLWVKEKALYWDGGASGNSDIAYQNDPEIPHLIKDNDLLKDYREGKGKGIVGMWKWRPSIFMPRWASRITLEITGLRVERLQEINYRDVLAEGIILGSLTRDVNTSDARAEFRVLWDSLNAKRGYGWAISPWVWVIEFKTLQ